MSSSPAGGSRHVKPRELLVEPELFSRDPTALWLPFDPEQTKLAHLFGAYWQHLTACAIREMYPVDPEGELARQLGHEATTHFARQFIGEYRVQVDELFTWAFVLQDVSILPEFATARDLIPPGSGVERSDLA